MRNIYLKMKSLAEARAIVRERLTPLRRLEAERLPAPQAVGRVLAQPVFAAVSAPSYHAAAMDGIAVAAERTYGASPAQPIALALGREAFPVNTGNALPPGTDAVIMIENVRLADTGRAVIEAAAHPFQHVRKIGEDIVATELLFPRHHRLTPYCLGALLTGGVREVAVLKKPRVLIVPTGSELVDWRTTPPESLRPGQVLETNSAMLAALAAECGAAPETAPMIGDDPARIAAALAAGAEAGFDLVMVLGGSSAGSEDYGREALARAGEVLVHGITIMPGKPAVVGFCGTVPVFGIPGYQVSAIIVFEELVKPLLLSWLAQPEPARTTVMVEPTRKIASKLGLEEFVRVKLGEVSGRIVATPLPRGAGSITSITEADGIVRIPADVEGVAENTPVAAELLKPREALKRAIVIVGSHDNTLDLLADLLKASPAGYTLSSSHVGSMGGLVAIRRRACHLAGSHLLDPTDGSYNVAFVRKHLPGRAVRLVNLVWRDNGLIVRRGNPKAIRSLADLVRPEVRFVNRQAGSGTRILLDYRLKELGIDPAAIRGYDIEEFTHMSVAVAVQSGSADAGLGITAAARALDLDFVPVATEKYDLVIPAEHLEDEKIRHLLEIIVSEEFKRRVAALGGYDTRSTGEAIDISP